MESVKREDGWWVTDIPECEDCGPYDNKGDAEDTRRGLERFYKHKDEPGYITTDQR